MAAGDRSHLDVRSFPQTTKATLAVPSFAPTPPAHFYAPRAYDDYNNHQNHTDYADDDIFGSTAWKKRRGKRPSKRSEENGGRDGNGRHGAAGDDDSKRWAVVKLLERRLQQLRDHLSGIREYTAAMSKQLFSSKAKQSAAGVGQNGVAVPTANGIHLSTPAVPGGPELNSEVLVHQARLLVGSYIHCRLSGKGLMSKRVAVAPCSSVLSDELCAAGQELERLYPRTYTDVSRRICMTMTSAQLVRRALTSVLEGTFKAGVTWAKVVSMVVIAAAFAEECVVQGHPNFVEDVVMCVGHFVSLNLTGWLTTQGGWAAFPVCRAPVTQKTAPSSSPVLCLSLVFLAVSIVILLLSKLLLDVT